MVPIALKVEPYIGSMSVSDTKARRGPMMYTPRKAAMPLVTCTTPEPLQFDWLID